MIKNIDYDRVAHILKGLDGFQQQLPLVGNPENVTNGQYYEHLRDIVEMLVNVREIFAQVPDDMVEAIGMSFEVIYRDNVIGGHIRVSGSAEEDTV